MSGRLINEKQLKKKARAVRTGIELFGPSWLFIAKLVSLTDGMDQAGDVMRYPLYGIRSVLRKMKLRSTNKPSHFARCDEFHEANSPTAFQLKNSERN